MRRLEREEVIWVLSEDEKEQEEVKQQPANVAPAGEPLRRSKWLISRQPYREMDDEDDHEEDKKRVKRIKRRHSSPVAGPSQPRQVRPLLRRSSLSNRAALLIHLLSLLHPLHLALDQVRGRGEEAQHQKAQGEEEGPQVRELQGIEPEVQDPHCAGGAHSRQARRTSGDALRVL